MARAKIMLARISVNGTIRQEVADFALAAEQLAHRAMQDCIEELVHVKIQACPTPVARNNAVAIAQQADVHVLFQIDDDMEVPGDFFERAVRFLLSQSGPAIIAVPYVCAMPIEEVQVFEWGSMASDSKDANLWAVRVTREDAGRRQGIQDVYNIGTGCVAYRMDAFDQVAPPYYDYAYGDVNHTRVIETEDCWAHRRMTFAGVRVYCDWESWGSHHKIKRGGKPVAVSRKDIDRIYLEQAKSLLRHDLQPPPQHVKMSVSCRDATALLPRPDLEPREGAFPIWADGDGPGAGNFAMSVPGWMSAEELQWLAREAGKLPLRGRWVEVGVWKGRSLSAVFLSAPSGSTVVAVDTWEGSPEERDSTHREAKEEPRKVFESFLSVEDKLRRLRSDVTLVVEPYKSRTIAESFEQGHIQADVAFIDAAHDQVSVEGDIDAWLSLVAPGGMLCGHDRDYSGVQAALRSKFIPASGLKLEYGPGSLWYVRTPTMPKEQRNGTAVELAERR